jgi:hypothetical protein
MAAASATMVVMGTTPMNTNIMRRRVVDQPLFHLANERQSIVICGIFVGSTDLPFSKTSISKGWPASVNHDRRSAVVAIALIRCDMSFEVVLDLALIFAG